MKALTIAVAGAGIIGRRHVELVAESPLCTLTALVDPAPAAIEAARAAGVPLYASLPELFAAQRPDGVIIATPNPLHVDHDGGSPRPSPARRSSIATRWGAARSILHASDAGERVYERLGFERTSEMRLFLG